MQTFNTFTGGERLQDMIGNALGHYYNIGGRIDATGYYDGRLIIRTKDSEKSELNADNLIEAYINSLEKILKEYPEQWFNYFNFWNE